MTQTAVRVLGKWNGMDIEQRSDGYVNVTQLCDSYKKKFWRYRDNVSAKRFITALAYNTERDETQLITKGGRLGHTFVHPRIALHAAEWLSPACSGWLMTQLDANKAKTTKAAPKVAKVVPLEMPKVETINGMSPQLKQMVDRLTMLTTATATTVSMFATETADRLGNIEQQLEDLPARILTAMQPAKTTRKEPRKKFLTQNIADTFTLPPINHYMGTRTVITDIVAWVAERWEEHPQKVFNTLYNALSNQVGIDIKHHHVTWYKPTYHGAIVDFVVEKGYGFEAVALAHSMWGNGQEFQVVALDLKKATRTQNMDPVGPRAGVAYIPHTERPAHGYTRRANPTVDMVSQKAQAAMLRNRQRRTMADRLDATDGPLAYADSVEQRLSELNSTDKKTAAVEPFLAAQQQR